MTAQVLEVRSSVAPEERLVLERVLELVRASASRSGPEGPSGPRTAAARLVSEYPRVQVLASEPALEEEEWVSVP